MTSDKGLSERREKAVEVHRLHHRHGDHEAVRGISFSVPHGELLALLGTNGAGKTTTLELLQGYRPPTAGTVRVLGLDPYAQGTAVRRRTGMMLQEGGFFRDLTVRETVDAWRTFTTGARPTGEALELVGLTDRARTRVGQLSGGERRRLDLALAVLRTPEVLFLDEPTTGMDPQARQATWQTVRDLRAAGTTVLLTTHYLEEAQQLADRVAILDRGRLTALGTVAEVLSGRGTRITFPLPAGVGADRLPLVPGGHARVVAGTAEYTVERTGPALAALHGWAAGLAVELDGLEVRGASLEDVFLDLPGLELPGAEPPEAARPGAEPPRTREVSAR
ncbi:ABC transporter ATP-binding protein [Kitasatospora sp. NPDC091335]|uniref:ABC transporter ATP-binding protein n=1 Tax=Kitasatospora sp. NPDC091335 TaxID=3364085 RepID=UPI0038100934